MLKDAVTIRLQVLVRLIAQVSFVGRPLLYVLYALLYHHTTGTYIVVLGCKRGPAAYMGGFGGARKPHLGGIPGYYQ